jgi:hypothetical protein
LPTEELLIITIVDLQKMKPVSNPAKIHCPAILSLFQRTLIMSFGANIGTARRMPAQNDGNMQ